MKNDKPIDILNYIKWIDSFSNVYITYKIMLKISVSTMSQERLNELILLSIEE